MKTLQVFLYSLLALMAAVYSALSAEPEKPKSYLNGLSVSPYATIAFQNFNGKSTDGAGLEVALPLSKTVSLVTFAEGDSWDGSAIDRAGAGLQVSGKLGRLRPFGRLGAGYTFDAGSGLDAYEFFLRPQFGLSLDLWRNQSWYAALTGSWGLDVDLSGNTSQRLFGGISLGKSF